jgi:hypothetical protein
VKYLEEQLDWFKRQVFGKRSERMVANLNEDQLTFDGFENIERVEEEKETVAAYQRTSLSVKNKIKFPYRLICQYKQ